MVSLKEVKQEAQLSLLGKDILHSLIYFNIFKYPLRIEELFSNSSVKTASLHNVIEEADLLVKQGLINKVGDWYYIYDNRQLIAKRITGNALAAKYMGLAKKVGCFIACFPFVRGVFISGSLSKGYMDKDSDFDFFVVTAPNRLWLCRTLLIIFKKIFLLNSKKIFCPNYFIDTEHLEIPDQNMFTAKEINYLIPVYNKQLYKQLLTSNEWREDYMPNFSEYKRFVYSEAIRFKDFIEKLLNGKTGEWLDNLSMKVTERFWQKKHKEAFGNNVSIRCRKYVSKFHPKGYQNRVIESYKENIKAFEIIYNVNLY